MTTRLVAIINHEPTFRYHVARQLANYGFDCIAGPDDESAMPAMQELQPNAIVIETGGDSALPATAIIEQLRATQETREIPIVVCSPDDSFISGYRDYLQARDCLVVGRPFDARQMATLLDDVTRPPMPLDALIADAPVHA